MTALTFGIAIQTGCTKEMTIQDKPHVMGLDNQATDSRSDLPAPKNSASVAPQERDLETQAIALASKSPRDKNSSALTIDLEHGQRNFEIYCSLCHDRSGSGQGMITLRGFPKSRSLTSEVSSRLSLIEIQKIIREGQNPMPAFRGRLTEEEMKQIAIYIRALQFSHHIPRAWLNDEDLKQLSRHSQIQKSDSPNGSANESGGSPGGLLKEAK